MKKRKIKNKKNVGEYISRERYRDEGLGLIKIIEKPNHIQCIKYIFFEDAFALFV